MLEPGGKEFAKQVILNCLECTSGSNTKFLQALTGLPPELLHPLLAELMDEGKIRLDRVIFRKVRQL
jgi:hypothetical protein